MDKILLEMLACPVCKSGLQYQKSAAELLCAPCRVAYPIRDDIPVMLIEEARQLENDEDTTAS